MVDRSYYCLVDQPWLARKKTSFLTGWIIYPRWIIRPGWTNRHKLSSYLEIKHNCWNWIIAENTVATRGFTIVCELGISIQNHQNTFQHEWQIGWTSLDCPWHSKITWDQVHIVLKLKSIMQKSLFVEGSCAMIGCNFIEHDHGEKAIAVTFGIPMFRRNVTNHMTLGALHNHRLDGGWDLNFLQMCGWISIGAGYCCMNTRHPKERPLDHGQWHKKMSLRQRRNLRGIILV